MTVFPSIVSFVKKRPALLIVAVYTWRLLWKIIVRVKGISDSMDWDRVYMVDPRKISFAMVSEFPLYAAKAQVKGGNWDLEPNIERFEDKDVYKAFYARFVDGKEWLDTAFYARVVGQIRSGNHRWGCKNEQMFQERLQGIDKLYETIKSQGFRSRNELTQRGVVEPSCEDDVSLVIGREGDLIFNNGRHRLCIAKILEIPEIPVRVTVRHKKWVEFRQELSAFIKQNGEEHAYQPLTHPDLGDMQSQWTEARFDILRSNLPGTTGTVLDLGANFGFFCQKLEELGYTCRAVEYSPSALYFLKKLRRAGNYRFDILATSILDLKFDQRYDIVLALNIFHHFLKDKESYERFLAILERLDAGVMFFQAHNPNEGQMENAYRNYEPAEFAALVMKHGGFEDCQLIGEDKGRLIYKLTSAEPL